MCGIAGVLYRDPARLIERDALKAMGDAIAHRGPDAEGIFIAPGVGMAHRRLSIIDLAGGNQPIGNEDGTVQVVFNGEIYNFQSLRDDLMSRGHRFKTQSDTEVIVHLYEEYGDSLVERLRGMFAFALWDARRRRLLLARDRVGVKPLYVYRDGEKLVFGSELKAILAHSHVPRRLDVNALESYLAFGVVTGSQAIFADCTKLPSGHVLSVSHAALRQPSRPYWRLRLAADEHLDVDEWQEALRAKIDETVRMHLIADVPVGALLSGGVDSSVVVARSAGQTNGQLRSYAIGFSEQQFNELPYAREVAEQFGTLHEEAVVTPDAAGLLHQLTHYFDEPFADASAIPTFLVAGLARRDVKVVLSGDGGDEAFGGYRRYAHDLREAALRRCLPAWFRRHGLARLARFWPKTDWLPRPLRAKTLLTNLSLEPDAAYANTLACCRQPLRRELLAPEIAATLNGAFPEDHIRAAFKEAPRGDLLGGMIAADTATLLPDDFLVKTDRATMAHGLELRPPLVDHELLELAARIPSRFKVRRSHTKWIFKQAFREQLPPTVLSRAKQGFDVPTDDWLRGPLRPMFEACVLNSTARVGELIDRSVARRLFTNHCAGVGRHGNVLWSLLILAKWCEQYRPELPG
jgi:asparagine synthase (glutamine-hydrolysing)